MMKQLLTWKQLFLSCSCPFLIDIIADGFILVLPKCSFKLSPNVVRYKTNSPLAEGGPVCIFRSPKFLLKFV